MRWSPAERRWLVALLLLAAALRTAAWLRTAVLFDDGPLFLQLAGTMAAGDWSGALQHPYHPLYPAAVALAHMAIPDLEIAAVAVSIAAGTAAVALLHGFLRDSFDSRTGLIGAALLAVHPQAVDYSSDVQSEGLYIALLLASLWLLWRGLEGRRGGLAAAAGLVSGLAYLTRPEGVGTAVVGCVAGLALAVHGTWPKRRTLAWGGLLLAGLALPLISYVWLVHVETGEWHFTQKKSVLAMAGFDPVPGSVAPAAGSRGTARSSGSPTPESASGEGVPSATGPAAVLGRVYRSVTPALRFELWPLLTIGLWMCRGRPSGRGLFLGAFVGLHAIVLFALASSEGYVDKRHALPPLLALFGYVALAVPRVGEIVLRGLAGVGALRSAGPPILAALVGFALVAVFALPRDLRERRSEKLAERRAAEWIAARDDAPGAVAAARLRTAYYARAAHVPLPIHEHADFSAYLLRRGARYLILDPGERGLLSGLPRVSAGRLELLHQERARGREAFVYGISPSSPGPVE